MSKASAFSIYRNAMEPLAAEEIDRQLQSLPGDAVCAGGDRHQAGQSGSDFLLPSNLPAPWEGDPCLTEKYWGAAIRLN